ncbi:MAG: DeoR/GlpR family DNA-binding transcription regulator [Actinomycetota bacterium]
MMIAERRRLILAEARAHGIVALRDLVDLLGTSEPTVRRDLRALAAQGLLHRTHGGAMLISGPAHEPTFSEKLEQAGEEKAAIASVAARLVHPGDSVILGPGTTTLALATQLVDVPELTVVTNSLLVAQALLAAPAVEVVVTAGSLRRSIHALVGPATEHTLAGLRATRVFMSGNGLCVERGLTTPNMLVAAADRALAAAGRDVVVLADYTKIGVDTMCQTLQLHQMAMVITDWNADDAEVGKLRDAGLKVSVAAHGAA